MQITVIVEAFMNNKYIYIYTSNNVGMRGEGTSHSNSLLLYIQT